MLLSILSPPLCMVGIVVCPTPPYEGGEDLGFHLFNRYESSVQAAEWGGLHDLITPNSILP